MQGLTDLKNQVANQSVNIFFNHGELIILYLFGSLALTLAFFEPLIYWLYNLISAYEQETLIIDAKEIIANRERLAEILANSGSSNGNLDGGQQPFQIQENDIENEQLKQKIQDQDVIKEPKFFLKISNSYFVSAGKYGQYLKNFMFKKRKNQKSQQNQLSIENKPNTNNQVEQQLQSLGIEQELKKRKLGSDCKAKDKIGQKLEQSNEKQLGLGGVASQMCMTLENLHNQHSNFKNQLMQDILEEETKRNKNNNQQTKRRKRRNSINQLHNCDQNNKQCNHSDENSNLAKNSIINLDCMICFSQVADTVIIPCGHGGICFECAKKLIKEAIQKIEPIILNNNKKIYNFKCPMCRNIGLKVYQLKIKDEDRQNNKKVRKRQNKDEQTDDQCYKYLRYINLTLNPYEIVRNEIEFMSEHFLTNQQLLQQQQPNEEIKDDNDNNNDEDDEDLGEEPQVNQNILNYDISQHQRNSQVFRFIENEDETFKISNYDDDEEDAEGGGRGDQRRGRQIDFSLECFLSSLRLQLPDNTDEFQEKTNSLSNNSQFVNSTDIEMIDQKHLVDDTPLSVKIGSFRNIKQ